MEWWFWLSFAGVVAVLLGVVTLSILQKREMAKWAAKVFDPGWSVRFSFLENMIQGAIQGHQVIMMNRASDESGGERGYCFLLAPVVNEARIAIDTNPPEGQSFSPIIERLRNSANFESLFSVIKPTMLFDTLLPVQFRGKQGLCLCKKQQIQKWDPVGFKRDFEMMIELAETT